MMKEPAWNETSNSHHKFRYWPRGKRNIFISVPGLSKEFRRIFWHTSIQVIFKWANILKSIIMHPGDKISSQLKQITVYKWSCQEENFNLSYTGKSSRCLENRVKEHNSHVTSVVYILSISNNHPRAKISKLMNHGSKQVAREARGVMHIRINDPALNCNRGRIYITKIFSHLLGADRSSNESIQGVDSDFP